MPQALTHDDEQKLLKAAEEISDLVASEGITPTAAVVKVANRYGMGPDTVRLLSRTYNVGAVTHQRQNNSDILRKQAAIPLADGEEAVQRLLHSEKVAQQTSSGVSSMYSRPPSFRLQTPAAQLHKVASAVNTQPPDEQGDLDARKRVQAKLAAAGRLEALRDAELNVQQQVSEQLDKLATYFNQEHYPGDLQPQDILDAATAKFGRLGQLAVKTAMDRAGCAPRQMREPRHKSAKARPVLWQAAPYSIVSALVAGLKQAQQLAKSAHEAAEQCKAASLFGVAMMTDAAKRLTSDLTPSRDSLVRGALKGLDSPAHNDELRSIQSQAILQDFLLNDDVISGYDPQEVMSAYNEIASMAPRTATQPAAMRAALRKRLTQGDLQSFETRELADIESSLSRIQPPAALTSLDMHGIFNPGSSRSLAR